MLTLEGDCRSTDGDLAFPEFAVVILQSDGASAAVAPLNRTTNEVRVNVAGVLLIVRKATLDLAI